MKKLVSILSLLLVIGVASVSAQCAGCKVPAADKKACCSSVKANGAVKAYYFHATRRCATCQAVEKVTKEAIKDLYGNKVSFVSINRDTEKENPAIKKYKVNGQTLLIVGGDKVVNLTNAAFMNARTRPEKLKSKIKSTIDSML
ncbi:hypothetical protein EYV94_01595 [Puteibacter caeruleilacunae]|nr:hypothetical protein EYV94_01595 [Puteibacter caeruleilacunae]